MFSHVTVGANDVVALIGFYDAVLAPLGMARFWTDEEWGRRRVAGGGGRAGLLYRAAL